MKKLMVFLLILAILPAGAFCDSSLDSMFKSTSHYENLVYGYGVYVPDALYMLTDEELDYYFGEDGETEDDEEEMGEVYDLRYWVTEDSKYNLQIQVKEPTYESFDIEVSKASEYLSYVEPGMTEAGYTEITQLHDGILRDTSLGKVLEMALHYRYKTEEYDLDIISVYYDYYLDGVEYIFYIRGYDTTYDTICDMLSRIVETVVITPKTTTL